MVSGSGQSATVAKGFASPLVVVVDDAYGNPVPGVSVTFAAPASGASAALSSSTATTGANGQASVTATADTIAGSYIVTASVAGVTTPASFSLTNTPGAGGGRGVLRLGPVVDVDPGFASPLVAVVDRHLRQPSAGRRASPSPHRTSGASAALSSSTATTGANGQASVTATADTIAGSYTVTASVSGLTTKASFSLSQRPFAAASTHALGS